MSKEQSKKGKRISETRKRAHSEYRAALGHEPRPDVGPHVLGQDSPGPAAQGLGQDRRRLDAGGPAAEAEAPPVRVIHLRSNAPSREIRGVLRLTGRCVRPKRNGQGYP